MLDLLATALQDGYMPHGVCYLWRPGLVGLHVVSDSLIAVAYFAIPPALIYFVVKAREMVPANAPYGPKRVPYEWMFLAFGLFIVACGATHAMNVWTLWEPRYWLSGGVKAVTAVASLATAIALPPLIPRALRLVRDARESEVRRARLEETNAELADLYEQLKEFDELRSRFFANVSHELRTPLTLILSPTDRLLASEEALTPEVRRELLSVRDNARLLTERVDQLLDVARLDAGTIRPDRRSVDLSEVVRREVDRYRTLADESGIGLEVRAPEALSAEVDPEHLCNIVGNLLANAMEFTPSGGTVRCEVRAETEAAAEGSGGDGERRESTGTVVLEVADSGPGIPREMRETVFERFRQVDGGSTRRHGGTGLGLSIVRDLVNVHGGRASIHEAPEGGALVRVRLPRRAPDEEGSIPRPGGRGPGSARSTPLVSAGEGGPQSPATWAVEAGGVEPRERDGGSTEGGGIPGSVPDGTEPRRTEPVRAEPVRKEPEGAGSAGSGRARGTERARVLVVEDDEELRGFLARILSPRFAVETAADGREGLEKARRTAPDLILTDIMMPEMDGEEMIRSLREKPATADIPVVVLTARADDDLRVRLLRDGARDYVTKPFRPEEVRARVENLVTAERARRILARELEGHREDLEDAALELTEGRRRLRRVLEEARRARDEAEAANRAKTRFLGVVSHELRTPLNGVVLNADLLAEGLAGPVSEKQEEHLDRIRSSARALGELVDRIVEVARTEPEEGNELRAEPVDAVELAGEERSRVREEAADRGLELELEVPDEPVRLETDPEALRGVLRNLLSNAIRFTPEGRAGIRLETGADDVVFNVWDTGIGLPPEEPERVFEPFWQADQSLTRASEGVGLGLYEARERARRLGGRLTAEPREGGGTVFVLRIPRATPGTEARAPERGASAEPTDADPSSPEATADS